MRRSEWAGWLIIAGLTIIVLIAGCIVIARTPTFSQSSPAVGAVPLQPLQALSRARIVDASSASRGITRDPILTPNTPLQADGSGHAPKRHRATADNDEQTATVDEPVEASPTHESLSPGDIPEPWHSVIDCETGGTFDPAIISPGGDYFGLFQFSLSTWRSVGGSGYPSDASVAEQFDRAQQLQRIAGWDQWPQCAAFLY